MTKNDDGRLVYLTPVLKTLLTEQLERVKALEKRLGRVILHLFPHLGVKGGHVNPRLVGTQRRDFRKAWVSACVAAGLGTVDPVTKKKSTAKLRHDCRRSAARNLVEHAGVSEKVAMTITGHRTRSVFDRYHIVSKKDLQAAAVKIAQFASR
jgi:integrase